MIAGSYLLKIFVHQNTVQQELSTLKRFEQIELSRLFLFKKGLLHLECRFFILKSQSMI